MEGLERILARNNEEVEANRAYKQWKQELY